MYVPDLHTMPLFGSDWKIVNVGWLDADHPYSKGKVSPAFIARLLVFQSKPYIFSYGIFPCPLCKNGFSSVPAPQGLPTNLFSSKKTKAIRRRAAAPGGQGIFVAVDIENHLLYRAPAPLIPYYVAVHNYKPPEQFIKTVLNGPLPTTPDYDQGILALSKDYFRDASGN
jgi:hypothetical protein